MQRKGIALPTESKIREIRPYSPRTFNMRGKARFSTDRWARMLAHLGRDPSHPERLIIARAISIEWELRKIDARVDAGEELTGHALRARLAGENRLRLDLASIGLKSRAADRPMTLQEHIRANKAAMRRGEL
jgi:hypothetical protein